MITSSAFEETSNFTTKVHRKFLAFCIHTEIILFFGEIEVSSVTNNSKLFEEIKNKYHTLRSYKVRAKKLFLFQPFNIKFVKVHIFRAIWCSLAN